MGDYSLIDAIAGFDEKPFLQHKDQTRTYGELSTSIGEWRQILDAHGITYGAVVAIVGDYSFATISLFLALHKNKNIIVPITSTLPSDIDTQIDESFADWVVTFNNSSYSLMEVTSHRTSHFFLSQIRERNVSGLILFSSGSEGKPKAMIHDLDLLVASFRHVKPKKIVILVFLMFDHVGGINTLLNILATGSLMVIPESRNAAEVGSLIEKHRINVLPSTPTFLNLMLINSVHEKFDLSSLKIISYGTEPMPEELLRKLRLNIKKVRFIQTFGTSETGIAKTTSKSSDSTSFRLEELGGNHKIVNGELWLRSETQVLGYLNASMDQFTEDGWFKTGDLVHQESDGFFTIIGRNKEVINVGGEKVLPVEVESVVLQMSEVTDCMVYPEENAITGSGVAVEVCLAEDLEPATFRKKLRSFCSERLAKYKIPTKIRIVDRTTFGARFKKMRMRAGG